MLSQSIYYLGVIFLDERISTITYDENWQNVSEPEYPVLKADAEEDSLQEDGIQIAKNREKKPTSTYLLLTIQLIACLIIALAAFVIKSIGGELYEVTHSWYSYQLNNTAIFDNESGFDPHVFLVGATPDEA